MGKFRDAETGTYISEEEAQMRDPSTWVEEHDDAPSRSDLRKIYELCKTRAITPDNGGLLNNTSVVPLDVLERVLNKFGANIK